MSDKKPNCKLIGTDGNVFSIIGKVSATLKKAGKSTEAKEFTDKAFKADSYNAVLVLAAKYVSIS